jgi:choice-of-anchor C domain-containing protein
MRNLLVLLFAGALLLLPAFAQHSDTAKPENLASNGGFEQGPDPGGFKVYKKGERVSGWTVASGEVDHIGSYFKCARGRCLDMNGYNVGAVRQAIATEPGRKYKVSFSLSANPQCGTPKKTLRVSAAGQAQQFSVTAKPTLAWARRSWEFTAKEDKTSLQFQSVNQPSACGPLLDEIAVTLVPEEPPATESR